MSLLKPYISECAPRSPGGWGRLEAGPPPAARHRVGGHRAARDPEPDRHAHGRTRRPEVPRGRGGRRAAGAAGGVITGWIRSRLPAQRPRLGNSLCQEADRSLFEYMLMYMSMLHIVKPRVVVAPSTARQSARARESLRKPKHRVQYAQL